LTVGQLLLIDWLLTFGELISLVTKGS